MMLLEVADVTVRRGKVPVIHGASLGIDGRESVCLLGRNGMGKTTLLRSIMGLSPVRTGSIVLGGMDITRQPPHAVARLGVGYVPQGRGIFPDLSVEENLAVGLRGGERPAFDRVYAVFPRLRERRRQAGGTLSGGEQQMLAIGRALMARPKVMLLDEPSMGLAPVIVQEVFETVRRLKREGMTMLLVEQFARTALEVADRAYVMERGRIVMEGTPAELQRDERVIAAYLG